MCRACCWAYRTPLLRTVPHLIVRCPELLLSLSGSELHAALARPLTSGSAIVVPLRPGRKHVISGAAWGRIVTDDALLSWTDQDVACLDVVDDLRAAGFKTRSLYEPAPPHQVVRQLPAEQIPNILTRWDQLQPWRTNPVRMQIACKTTRVATGATA